MLCTSALQQNETEVVSCMHVICETHTHPQDTVPVGEITDKESKEMFPQGLPKDFVKQVYVAMVHIYHAQTQKCCCHRLKLQERHSG